MSQIKTKDRRGEAKCSEKSTTFCIAGSEPTWFSKGGYGGNADGRSRHFNGVMLWDGETRADGKPSSGKL
ncbi:hypothetical protein QQF64_002457 [Cirrhinus molitorella]|uniref:Uncharacterized protein n=1 Tax=Cirrhinus molitorella TaxID=172907 RepID=A0ABR3MQ90_9TELE